MNVLARTDGCQGPGAHVTILNVDTGSSRSMKSGSDGEYNFPDLPLGNYKIRAAHSGFKGSEQTGIVLHVNDSLVVNVSMETDCGFSIVITTIGNNFGIVTQSRENGWRQIQYGLKFTF